MDDPALKNQLWRPDVLGERFEQLTLPLKDDFEGEVSATLVRHTGQWRPYLRKPPAFGFDILYVHGWNDYFFQTELAEFWHAAGARFYALDLRKYGRSLRTHQTPGFISDLGDYDEEIAAALQVMGQAPAGAGIVLPELNPRDAGHRGRALRGFAGTRRHPVELARAGAVSNRASGQTGAVGVVGPGGAANDAELRAEASPGAAGNGRPLLLLGHSTGGLILSLWANRHPGRAHALILNSPWLELQISRLGREALTPMVRAGARMGPLSALPNIDLGFYNRSISKQFEGEWEFDARWRPERGFPIHTAWLAAILDGHARVAAGLNVCAPVLTLLSARSTFASRWMPEMSESDSVIVVDDNAQRSLRLGPSVTVNRFDGALHDVFLSRKPVRAQAYDAMARWIRGYL